MALRLLSEVPHFGGDPSALLEADERGVDGALIEQDLVAAGLLDAAGDAVAVERSHGFEGLQHHHVEGALKEIKFFGRQGDSCVDTT